MVSLWGGLPKWVWEVRPWHFGNARKLKASFMPCLQIKLVIASYRQSSKLWSSTMNKLAAGAFWTHIDPFQVNVVDDNFWGIHRVVLTYITARALKKRSMQSNHAWTRETWRIINNMFGNLQCVCGVVNGSWLAEETLQVYLRSVQIVGYIMSVTSQVCMARTIALGDIIMHIKWSTRVSQ